MSVAQLVHLLIWNDLIGSLQKCEDLMDHGCLVIPCLMLALVIWVGLNKTSTVYYIWNIYIYVVIYVHVDDINERFNSNYAQLVVALHFERFSAWDPSVYLCHYAPFQTVLPSDHSSIDVMSGLTAHVQSGNAPNTMLRIHHKPAPVWAWFSRPSMDLPSLFAGTRGEKRGKKKSALCHLPYQCPSSEPPWIQHVLQYFLTLPQVN